MNGLGAEPPPDDVIDLFTSSCWARFWERGANVSHPTISSLKLGQTKGMRTKRACAQLPGWLQSYVSVAPAYPKCGPEFVRKLKAALDAAECEAGNALPQKSFAAIVGIPKSTMHDWVEGPLPDPIRALLCGLERLSHPQRVELLRGFLRDCPRLSDPMLAHSPGSVKAVKALLSQRRGLSLIQSTTPRIGRFLFSAIGNSTWCTNLRKTICGIDLHLPENLSPVPGIVYVHRAANSETTRTVVKELWRAVRKSDADVLMLSGCLTSAPELWPEVQETSGARHVIVAENPLALGTTDTARGGHGATLLNASTDASTPMKISIAISTITVSR